MTLPVPVARSHASRVAQEMRQCAALRPSVRARYEMKKKAEKAKETPAEFTASMAAVLVIGLFIVTFCMQAFAIPTGSMERTLLIGDHVFVDRATMGPKTSWMPLIPYG